MCGASAMCQTQCGAPKLKNSIYAIIKSDQETCAVHPNSNMSWYYNRDTANWMPNSGNGQLKYLPNVGAYSLLSIELRRILRSTALRSTTTRLATILLFPGEWTGEENLIHSDWFPIVPEKLITYKNEKRNGSAIYNDNQEMLSCLILIAFWMI